MGNNPHKHCSKSHFCMGNTVGLVPPQKLYESRINTGLFPLFPLVGAMRVVGRE